MSKKIGLLLAGLVLLPGCIRVPTYKFKSLNVFKKSCSYTHSENGITIRAKQLNKAERDYIFDGRTQLSNSSEIVYVSIYNLSAHDYVLAPEQISLAQIPLRDIKKTAKKTSSTARFMGAGLNGVAAYGSVGATACVIHQGIVGSGTAPLIVIAFVGTIGIALSAVVVPLGLTFLAQGIKSVVMNSRMHRDLEEKILHKDVVIESGDKYEGLIFVKSSDYKPCFSLVVSDATNYHDKITFHVGLNQQ